jgi:HPt (histidine-containing phosphotransfer) domain-containing protein
MSDDIVREFLVESSENLDRLDRELIHLEKDPENRDTLASVFRTIHTIKGACGFLGFTKLESVAHVGEDHCMLSVPTVISGEDYSMEPAEPTDGVTVGFIFDGEPLWVSLITHP